MKLILANILIAVALTKGDADAVSSQNKPEQLVAEHRAAGSRSADPEPFLDRIASLFSGGSPAPQIPQKKAGNRPKGPVYRPPNPPTYQQQPSIQRPVAVKPPQTYKKPIYSKPSGLQTSASNLRPVSQPGKKSSQNRAKQIPFAKLHILENTHNISLHEISSHHVRDPAQNIYAKKDTIRNSRELLMRLRRVIKSA